MSKIAIILTEAIENSTSSMIRCKGIISALVNCGQEVTCFSPNSSQSIYCAEHSAVTGCGTIVHYGANIVADLKPKEGEVPRGAKKRILAVLYRLFKKVDVFGASLQYLRYRKSICNEIKGKGFDLLLTFSDPMTAHMIGKYCQRRTGIRYIQQWGDPLTTDTISKIALPRWIRYLIEQMLLKPADKICYVSPFTLDEQKELFKKQADKMIFLPTPCVQYPVPESKRVSRLKVGYFGSFNSVARDILPLYRAARNLPQIDFYFIGDSDVKLESKEHVTVIDRIPPDQLEKYIEETDVLVCLMNSKGNQVPGKFYHYAGSWKEILIIKDGEYRDQIEEFFGQYDRYTFVENDPAKIETVLKQYTLNGVPKREPLKAFDAENIALELIK